MQSNGIFKKFLLATVLALFVAACAKDEPPPPPPQPVDTTPPPVVDPGPGYEEGSLQHLAAFAGADRVHFAYDSADLNSSARATLGRQAEWLNDYSNVRITVEGHADSRGTREYNLALGERRATAVKNYLVALGVAANRIETISYGKERPLPNALCQAESCWSMNRRGMIDF